MTSLFRLSVKLRLEYIPVEIVKRPEAHAVDPLYKIGGWQKEPIDKHIQVDDLQIKKKQYKVAHDMLIYSELLI